MATSPEQREAAQNERDALKKVQASADLTIAAVAAAAIVVAPPLGLIGLVPAVIRWRATRELMVQERLVEDPPQLDFEEPVEPAFEPVFLDFPEWSDPLTAYVRHSVAVCGYEDAMITSIERSLGAQEHGESEHSVARARDAARFAMRTQEALVEAADSQSSLRNLVNSGELHEAEERLRTENRHHKRPTTPLNALPKETALWLFHAGAPAELFQTWTSEELPGHHPFSDLWLPLYANENTKRQLAKELVL